MPNEFQTIEDKIKNIERYLILQVDRIRRWVIAAFAVCTIAAVASLWIALRPPSRDEDSSARAIPPSETTARPAPAAPRPEPSPADMRADAARPSVPARTQPAVARPEPAPDDAAPTPPRDATATEPKRAVPPPREVKSRTATEASFRVEEVMIAPAMDGLQPVRPGTSFPTSTPRVYCWSRVSSGDLLSVPVDSRYVVHRWVHGDETVRERRIDIESADYRAYTRMNIEGRTGSWRVDILDARGNVIATKRFEIE
jgi:hypothetical protein